MFQRRRARVVLVVFVVLALVLVTIDFREPDGGPLAGAREVATDVLRPIQDGVATLVRPIGSAASNVSDWFATRSENQRLRDEVEALQERRRTLTDLERENRELRELLAIRDGNDLETVTARTVALGPNNFEWTITIDVGSEDGVERNMPVINGSGVVGRVIQVAPNAARVLLAIDPNFSAVASASRTGEIGVLDGRGGEPMLLRPLDPEADIEVGDEIVTSSYEGGLFPSGIPIGTVSGVADTGTRLTQEVTVAPFVDFTRVHHVMVVLSAPADELPDFSLIDPPEFERPPVDPFIDPDDLEPPSAPGPGGGPDADPDADDDEGPEDADPGAGSGPDGDDEPDDDDATQAVGPP